LKDLGIPANLTLNVNKEDRERLGIHATPAVLVDGKLVHSGGIPPTKKSKSG
jgi:arsenite/tail-anchored protein-transporting ATPase